MRTPWDASTLSWFPPRNLGASAVLKCDAPVRISRGLVSEFFFYANALARNVVLHTQLSVNNTNGDVQMKKLIAVTAFTLMCGSAFAQNTGAPAAAQNDMNKPGMNNSTMDKGAMNKDGMSSTSGMSSDNKGKPNKEMSKDGSPAAGSKDNMMKK